jgi:hypothetical protein
VPVPAEEYAGNSNPVLVDLVMSRHPSQVTPS